MRNRFARFDFRRIGSIRSGGISISTTVTSINPFAATAAPPDGYVFVAGGITLIVSAKPGSFGVTGSVSAQITAAGAITETVAGTVQTAVQEAGYTEGDTVTIYINNVETAIYVPPAGLTIHSRTVDRVGLNGTSTTQITHSNLAITQAAAQLIALEVYRGIGNINGTNFSIDGVSATQLAAFRTFQTNGRAHLRGITNASGDALATVAMTGLTSSTSASGICVLFSITGANTYSLTHVEAATGALSLSTTLSVLAGDLVVLVPFVLVSNAVSLTYTGATEVAAMAQNGTVGHFSGVAVQTISADNAAYPVGIDWTSGGQSPALVAAIIRRV